MLCLRKKICRDITWICSLICKNKDLAWSGNGVNADITINCFFCKGNKNISRSYDLVHFRDTLSSVCKSSDSLGTAHFINFICTGLIGSNQCAWIHLSFFSRRGCHYNTVHTCYFGRNDIHQYRRWIYSFSAWNINTYTVQCSYFLAKHSTVCRTCEPAVLKLLFMIAADIYQRFFDHINQRRIYQLISFLDLLRCNTDRLLCHFNFIKFSGKSKQRFISLCLYFCEDICYCILIFAIIIRTSF